MLLALPSSLSADEFIFHHENVLGTSAEFRVFATDENSALKAEQAILTEIDRLEAIYSTYSPSSELSQWMSGEGSSQVPPELFELLQLADGYQNATSGAFNPRVQSMTHTWKSAAAAQRIPSAAELQALANQVKESLWRLDAQNRTAEFLGSGNDELTFDAIAKGMIVEKSAKAGNEVANIDGVVVNIGGDLRVVGTAEQQVRIASPADRSHAIAEVRLQDQAMATSGGYYRFFEVQGQRFSHIIDPRNGKPVEHSSSVSVIATSATEADVFATALSVMPVSQALSWCNSQPGIECLIYENTGTLHTSQNWPKDSLVMNSEAATPLDDEAWPEGASFKLDFELARASGRRYHRPYVAVWIENEDEVPVRTLVLWLQEGKGSRWYRDLKRWYRLDRARMEENDLNLIKTISEATRPSGKYSATWDGKDDNGEFVKQGTYTLLIEVVREKGTYQLSKAKLEIGTEAFKGELEANQEVSSASFEYQK